MTEIHTNRRAAFLVLVALALLPRVILLRESLWDLDRDVDDYLRLADNLALWGTFGSYDAPTAFRPPLYPLLLAPLYWIESQMSGGSSWHVMGAAALHLLAGMATVLLTYWWADRHGLGRWSLLAGAIIALDPLLIHHTRRPMTEVLSAFFMAAALYFLSLERRSGAASTIAAGAALGLGMLCRPTFWAFVMIWTAAELAIPLVRKDVSRERWPRLAGVLTVALALQLPWAVRNWIALGQPILTTTHGGYTLLLGNNPVYYARVVGPAPLSVWSSESLTQWQSQLRIRAALDGVRTELEYDRYCYRAAWKTMFEQPGYFAKSVILRVFFLWNVMPHATQEYSTGIRFASAAFYVPVLLLGLIGLTTRRARQWPGLLLPVAILSFTLVHALYWSDMRMRAPLMPAVALLAACGAERVWRRREQPAPTD